MRQALLLALLVAAPCLAGCLAPFGLGLPDHHVERTALALDSWNRDGRFSVRVLDATPVQVAIEARADDGRTLHADGLSSETLPAIELDLPDGTWTVSYTLDGKAWETQGPARIDSTPPAIARLETLGTAKAGSYLLGQGASVEAGASVRVVRQADGAQVASALPVRLIGLADGVHGYDVVATDPAGNEAVETVQVRVGAATGLPSGRYALGITARYTSSARLWDLGDLDGYASPEAARQAVAGQWLGNGTGLTPWDPAVQAVVQKEVTSSMSTGRAALELFRWMVGNTEYDTARLASDDLLTPAQTIQAGGGVCRDLAALYASLLRGAGIPARLVAGYLGGRVGGFHAWVEFYGGAGHGPSAWVPVDVSAVDGPDRPLVTLQAFGARLPNMLGLHAVTPAQERGEWTHAAAMQASYPPGASPEIALDQNLTAEFREESVLCVDPAHLARKVAPDADGCGPTYPMYSPQFLSRASFILDYGVTVANAPKGTQVTATLAYPEAGTVAPDTVESLTYGAAFTKDTTAGTEAGTIQR